MKEGEQLMGPNAQRAAMLKKMEKAAWKSKKFIFGISIEIVLAYFVIMTLRKFDEINWPLATVLCLAIFTMGSIALVFNGYQAALDKYVRGAALTGIADKQRSLLESITGRSRRRSEEEYYDDEESNDRENGEI